MVGRYVVISRTTTLKKIQREIAKKPIDEMGYYINRDSSNPKESGKEGKRGFKKWVKRKAILK